MATLRRSSSPCLSHKTADMLDFVQSVCIKLYCTVLMSVLLSIQPLVEKKGKEESIKRQQKKPSVIRQRGKRDVFCFVPFVYLFFDSTRELNRLPNSWLSIPEVSQKLQISPRFGRCWHGLLKKSHPPYFSCAMMEREQHPGNMSDRLIRMRSPGPIPAVME